MSSYVMPVSRHRKTQKEKKHNYLRVDADEMDLQGSGLIDKICSISYDFEDGDQVQVIQKIQKYTDSQINSSFGIARGEQRLESMKEGHEKMSPVERWSSKKEEELVMGMEDEGSSMIFDEKARGDIEIGFKCEKVAREMVCMDREVMMYVVAKLWKKVDYFPGNDSRRKIQVRVVRLVRDKQSRRLSTDNVGGNETEREYEIEIEKIEETSGSRIIISDCGKFAIIGFENVGVVISLDRKMDAFERFELKNPINSYSYLTLNTTQKSTDENGSNISRECFLVWFTPTELSNKTAGEIIQYYPDEQESKRLKQFKVKLDSHSFPNHSEWMILSSTWKAKEIDMLLLESVLTCEDGSDDKKTLLYSFECRFILSSDAEYTLEFMNQKEKVRQQALEASIVFPEGRLDSSFGFRTGARYRICILPNLYYSWYFTSACPSTNFSFLRKAAEVLPESIFDREIERLGVCVESEQSSSIHQDICMRHVYYSTAKKEAVNYFKDGNNAWYRLQDDKLYTVESIKQRSGFEAVHKSLPLLKPMMKGDFFISVNDENKKVLEIVTIDNLNIELYEKFKGHISPEVDFITNIHSYSKNDNNGCIVTLIISKPNLEKVIVSYDTKLFTFTSLKLASILTRVFFSNQYLVYMKDNSICVVDIDNSKEYLILHDSQSDDQKQLELSSVLVHNGILVYKLAEDENQKGYFEFQVWELEKRSKISSFAMSSDSKSLIFHTIYDDRWLIAEFLVMKSIRSKFVVIFDIKTGELSKEFVNMRLASDQQYLEDGFVLIRETKVERLKQEVYCLDLKTMYMNQVPLESSLKDDINILSYTLSIKCARLIEGCIHLTYSYCSQDYLNFKDHYAIYSPALGTILFSTLLSERCSEFDDLLYISRDYPISSIVIHTIRDGESKEKFHYSTYTYRTQSFSNKFHLMNINDLIKKYMECKDRIDREGTKQLKQVKMCALHYSINIDRNFLKGFPIGTVLIFSMDNKQMMIDYIQGVGLEFLLTFHDLLKLFFRLEIFTNSRKGILEVMKNFYKDRYINGLEDLVREVILKENLSKDDLGISMFNLIMSCNYNTNTNITGNLNYVDVPMIEYQDGMKNEFCQVYSEEEEYRIKVALFDNVGSKKEKRSKKLKSIYKYGILTRGGKNTCEFEVSRPISKLDLSNGSDSSLELFNKLSDMPDYHIISVYIQLIYFKWNLLFISGIAYFIMYWAAAILAYLYFGYHLSNLPLGILLCVLNFVLILYEILSLVGTEHLYFIQISNYVDMISNLYSLILCITIMALGGGENFNVVVLGWLRATVVAVIWSRAITCMRSFKPMRHLIRMILAVFLDMLPFLTILSLMILIVAYVWRITPSLSSEEDSSGGQEGTFYLTLYQCVFILFGDGPSFDDDGGTHNTVRFICITLANILLALALLNFLIAIISSTYSRIEENRLLYDARELLRLIHDFDGFYRGFRIVTCRRKNREKVHLKNYLSVKKKVINSEVNDKVDEIMARIDELKKESKDQYHSLRDMIKQITPQKMNQPSRRDFDQEE